MLEEEFVFDLFQPFPRTDTIGGQNRKKKKEKNILRSFLFPHVAPFEKKKKEKGVKAENGRKQYFAFAKGLFNRCGEVTMLEDLRWGHEGEVRQHIPLDIAESGRQAERSC